MKKAILYTFAAIVIGVGIMLFPLWTFFRSYGEEGPIIGTPPYIKPMYASPNYQAYTEEQKALFPTTFSGTLRDYEERAKPTDSFLQMLTIGFIVALVAYVVVRRKSSRPTYLPSVRFPPY